MSAVEIIGGPASNYVWTCRIACAEKGVDYDLVPVMPHTPVVTAIHLARESVRQTMPQSQPGTAGAELLAPVRSVA